MPAKNYFTPDGYRPNSKALTLDATSGTTYWTPKRIRNATDYQFGVYRYAVRLIRERGIRSLVDVGCGVAPKLAWVHGKCSGVEIAGIDQESAIAYCRKTYRFGKWYVDDFESPSPELAAVRGQLAIASDVVEHLVDPDRLLDYLRQRVTDDGLLLISTPDRDALHGAGKLTCPNPNHIREWGFGEFRTYLEDRGFRVLKHFRDFAVRVAPTRLFLFHAVQQFRPWRSGQRLRYNQVCLASLT